MEQPGFRYYMSLVVPATIGVMVPIGIILGIKNTSTGDALIVGSLVFMIWLTLILALTVVALKMRRKAMAENDDGEG